MVLSFIIIFIFSVILMVHNIKNRYTWTFMILFLSLDIILVALMLRIIKISSYRSVFDVENYIYLVLNKIKISYYDVRYLTNLGVALFLAGMCAVCDFNSKHTEKYKYGKVYLAVLFGIPILIYCIFNSFWFSEKLFIIYTVSDTQLKRGIIEKIAEGIKIYDYVLIYSYMIMPFISFGKMYINTNIFYKKLQAKAISLSVAFIDLFFMIFFMMGALNGLIVNCLDLYEFYNEYPKYSEYIYTYMPTAVLVIFNVIFYIVIRSKAFDSIDFVLRKDILFKSKLMPVDIKHIFHSYKNAMFSIIILQQKVEQNYGTEAGRKDLAEIKATAQEYMNHAGDFINIFNDLTVSIEEINLINCIKNTINKIKKLYDIEIAEMYYCDEAYIFADEHQLSEAIYNILLNAVEAIKKKNDVLGMIKVSLYAEAEWMCVSICDNGIGMTGNEQRNIFKPLSSTKKSFKNWGIGLSYVYKVVKAHNGIISVKSVPNKYTEFQILLKSSRKYRKFGWRNSNV